MKIIIFLAAALLAFYLGSFLYLSIDSRRARETGLVNGKLRACPGTPNCVLSEVKDSQWYIEPLKFESEPAQNWANAKTAITTMGGRIEKESQGYLWATFRSKFWHFTDDLELRLDTANKVIHVRSASRVGKGDLGVNRKRVEALRALFNRI